MALASKIATVTVDEYLSGEISSDIKHEYDNGYVVAMVGASSAHNLIAGSLYSEIRRHLKGRPCQVYISDMKVRIQTKLIDRFYYPDVVVSCEKNPASEYFRDKPVLIIEVLSPSTETRDKLEKLSAYSTLPSLAEYFTVAQDRVEVTRYQFEHGLAHMIHYQDGDTVDFASIGFAIPVKNIYADVVGRVGE
ncbi:MAG: Uma2 family endonuclease [Pseudomonadota bacterium]